MSTTMDGDEANIRNIYHPITESMKMLRFTRMPGMLKQLWHL